MAGSFWRGTVRSRGAGAILAALALGALAGCGSSSFANKPRAPIPIEVSARITNRGVAVSPDRFGAGLVNFTVANLSDSPSPFAVRGPVRATSEQMEPSAVTTLKVTMKPGSYRAVASGVTGAKAAPIRVGPARRSAQNRLLLP